MSTQKHPKWLRDINKLLPIRAQFTLSGNIRDLVILPSPEGKDVLMSLQAALWRTLSPMGYGCFLIWDFVDGIRMYPGDNDPARLRIANAAAGLDLRSPQPMSLDALAGVARRICDSEQTKSRVALIIDYASRLREEGNLPDEVRKFFTKAEKAALEATPIIHESSKGLRETFFNPVVWLTNRQNDMPYWFTLDNERIRSIPLPLPDADMRKRASKVLWHMIMVKDISEEDFTRTLAALTHNMTLNAIRDIIMLANRENIAASDISDAVQSFKVGDMSMQSPWRGDHLRQMIVEAEASQKIEKRVKGQAKAAIKVLDILKRTSIGLTGAQALSAGSRPRGVLFFVGPTGVGKTEMAKTIAQIVFNDDSAYSRFDMSEFSSEHSGDRLIGAPPGYVGFDQGGELTNAIRENPFRVLLFDEIEKAHDRILDKFLQVLEDGRLTDGRGETVYFSESLIIFTSNLGISRELPDGGVEIMITPKDAEDQQVYEEKIMSGVKYHFERKLRRPELLNRIGENIVIFSYISQAVACEILAGMIENVKKRISDEHGVELELSAEVQDKLRRLCAEGEITNGGRGVGAKLEAVFVNPLARLIFSERPPSGARLAIADLNAQNGIYELVKG